MLFEGKVSSFVKASTNISGWKSSGVFSNDHNDTYPHLKSVSTSNGPPKLLIKNGRFCVDFNGNYIKQDKISYINFSAINIYIVYSLDPISSTRNADLTAQNCLFGAVKTTRNRNTSRYKYVGYGICFDEGSNFSFGNRIDARNVIILGCDDQSSSHANNKKNNIIVLRKDFTQGIPTDGTGNTIYAEKIYKTNMTEPKKNLHYHYITMEIVLFVC